MPSEREIDTNEKEELLRDHVDSEHGVHTDEPPQSTTTVVHQEAAEDTVAPVEALTVPIGAQTDVSQMTQQDAKTANAPGLLVLQWLTYAFWGWTAVALSWLGVVSVNYFVNGTRSYESSGSMIAYALAATVVLFVISFVCDLFYNRREPLHKKGMASVIMVIHAVIFALFGIGWLITAVFGTVRLVIGPESSYDAGEASTTLIIVGLVMAVVYAAALLRALRMKLQKTTPFIFWGVMGAVAAIFVGLGAFGPAFYANSTKNDRLIEANLNDVSRAINGYTSAQGKLPKTLQTIRGQLNEGGKTLVDNQLVEYKAGTQVQSSSNRGAAEVDPKPGVSLRYPDISDSQKKSFTYSLCVTYKSSKNIYGRYGKEMSAGADYRPSEPDVYYHDVGRTCYDLQTNSSYYPYPVY